MKKLMILAFLYAVSVQTVHADLYNGSISYSSGIYATKDWANTSTKISWLVSQNSDSSWRYSYTFEVPSKNISHFILEVSANFTSNDFLGFYNPPVLASILGTSGSWTAYEPTTYNSSGPGKSNPGIPGDIFGIKFEFNGDSTLWHFEFDCTKQPMWGDFYAKDGKTGGKDVYAYNKGFGIDILTDDGMHIAVPDTVVPVPAAVLLGMLGMAVAGAKLRGKIKPKVSGTKYS